MYASIVNIDQLVAFLANNLFIFFAAFSRIYAVLSASALYTAHPLQTINK